MGFAWPSASASASRRGNSWGNLVLGVRIRVPKRQLKRVQGELLARVRPLPGECTAAVAKRARAASRDMGLQVRPEPSCAKKLKRSSSGRGSSASAEAGQPTPGGQLPAPIGEQSAHQRKIASAFASLHASTRSGLNPSLRSQPLPGPAIGGTSADPAIGGKHLASQGNAHQTLALSESGCQQEDGATKTDSDGSMASGLARLVHHQKKSCFKVTEELGRGSFGKVYGGILEPSGQAVALKLLCRNPVRVEGDVLLQKEIQALKDLVHPCIVRLLGVTWTTYNVQVLLQKHETTLHQYLARRPAEAQAVQITTSLLKGLAHMHATNYVHRDLKSNNILVDSQPLLILGPWASGKVPVMSPPPCSSGRLSSCVATLSARHLTSGALAASSPKLSEGISWMPVWRLSLKIRSKLQNLCICGV
jgi:hypothetical protein